MLFAPSLLSDAARTPPTHPRVQTTLKQIGIIGAVAFVEYSGKYGGIAAAGSGGAM